MNKVKVLADGDGVAVEFGSFYDFVEFGRDVEGELCARALLTEPAYKRCRITPKKLRKLATALNRLADEVDPPKPSKAMLIRAYTLAYTPAECGPEGTWLH